MEQLLTGKALSWTAITAGGAAIVTFWSQIKGFLVRFNSMFIVNTTIEDELGAAVAFYLFDNLYRSPFGKMKYRGRETYVRPKSGYYVVAYEQIGEKMTFFRGWKPIFVSKSEGDNNRSEKLEISFLRGTYDLKALILEAVDYYNDFVKGAEKKKKSRKRYRVRKLFGRYGDGSRGGLTSDESVESSSSNAQLKPLGWDRDDLGSPVSTEPFSNLFYNDEINQLMNDVEGWFKSEEWFKEKGLDHFYGIGLEGPPGTGKSSFVRAVAQKYDMPVHHYDLSSMSNEEFVEYWRESLNCAPCVVLFEDMDRVFKGDKMVNRQNSLNKGTLTMDCILNCIQGVEASNGILLFVTVNDVSKLDPALGNFNDKGKSTRPGRLDELIHFGPMDEASRIKLAHRILNDTPELIEETVLLGDGETGAQFGKRCSNLARAEWKKRLKEGKIEGEIPHPKKFIPPKNVKVRSSIREESY